MSLGWSLQETKELFKVVENGCSLNAAFKEIALRYNRKPNSVRNYYYAQLKAFSLMPEMARKLGIAPKETKKQFATFSQSEVADLIKEILISQAQGRSVRSIVHELAEGDKTTMLRLQNKYRAVIASKRGRLDAIINQLNAEGKTYKHPITGQIVLNGETTKPPQSTTELLNEVKQLLLTLIKREEQ